MYQSTFSYSKNYLDNYGIDYTNDRILAEIQLNLEDFKLYSERSSSNVLDLFGDIGGFNDFIGSVFFMLVSSYAARALITTAT